MTVILWDRREIKCRIIEISMDGKRIIIDKGDQVIPREDILRIVSK